MRQVVVLLVACVVIAYHLQGADAQFSFSLPGKWGNGKRSFSFALPGKWGSGKRNGAGLLGDQCGQLDSDTLFHLLAVIQAEAARINDCLQKQESGAENVVEQSH